MRGVQVAMHVLQRVCILMHGVQISEAIHLHCNAQQEHRGCKAAALQSSRCEVFRLQCTACNKRAFGCTGCKSPTRSTPIARHSRSTGGAKCTHCKDLSSRSSGCNARLAVGLHSDARGANIRCDTSPLQCTAVVQEVQSSCIAILEMRGVQVAMHGLQ